MPEFLAAADTLLNANTPATLALLIGLELVLGIDNVLVISILVARLPEHQRDKARLIGLFLALFCRLVFVAGAYWLVQLTKPIVPGIPLSPKDQILLAGGLFLIWKAVKEIHHVVEMRDHLPADVKRPGASYAGIITQIVILDMVFSIDSVITAVGLTSHLIIIATAVIASFLAILAYAKTIGDFILRHPALKILALSFLVTIGITIFFEGMHKHIDKAYIYLPMGFALLVELLQMRYSANQARHQAEP